MKSARKLYDLAGADPNFRFSPYCWRVKLALAHKAIAVETIPWRFTEKDVIAFSGQGKVPVLVDGTKTIHDSFAIAEYLEAAYPNEASLFGDERATTFFINNWANTGLHPAIVKIVLPDIYKLLDPNDQPYFRKTREAMLGKTIEALAAERAAHLPAFNSVLAPVRETLRAQKFIAGAEPAYADHIVFGTLQWARLTSATPLLDGEDAILAWMAALLETYGI
jgi:glutathione S-transferase